MLDSKDMPNKKPPFQWFKKTLLLTSTMIGLSTPFALPSMAQSMPVLPESTSSSVENRFTESVISVNELGENVKITKIKGDVAYINQVLNPDGTNRFSRELGYRQCGATSVAMVLKTKFPNDPRFQEGKNLNQTISNIDDDIRFNQNRLASPEGLENFFRKANLKYERFDNHEVTENVIKYAIDSGKLLVLGDEQNRWVNKNGKFSDQDKKSHYKVIFGYGRDAKGNLLILVNDPVNNAVAWRGHGVATINGIGSGQNVIYTMPKPNSQLDHKPPIEGKELYPFFNPTLFILF